MVRKSWGGKSNMKKLLLSAASAFGLVMALSACGESAEPAEEAVVEAESAEPDAIASRQELLEGMGDAFRTLRGQMEGEADWAVIQANAETINANATQFINYFPEGTGMDSGADTEALAVIWEDGEGFAAAHARLLEASAGLVEAAATEDMATFQEAAGNLGGACKNCHDTYRKPQE
jgi:cytochrome c556